MAKSRAQHVAWCMSEELWHLDNTGNLRDAVRLFVYDLDSHPDTAGLATLDAGTAVARTGDEGAVVRWIEGFN